MSKTKTVQGNKSSPERGQPRKRVVPLWRSRLTLALLAVLALGALGGGGWALWKSGTVERAGGQVRWALISVTKKLGLTVREVMVTGRSQTTRKELQDAVRLTRGAPILAFDIEEAKRRVESLPWVDSAVIERMLPDTVFVHIFERTPLALWQNKGKFALIDSEGKVILKEDLGPFSDLLQVVGDDAPGHAAALLEVLASQPELLNIVKAAVRVGGRRWNILLDNGINVRLPEDNPETAWARLAEYERTHQVLERDIQVLDLRIPDRLIVRKGAKPEKTDAAPGTET